MIIKAAYFYSKGTFVAKAFVQYADGLKNDRRTALGDTAEEALNEAIGYIKSDFRKEGLPVPETIDKVGKIRREFAEAWIF